MLTLNVRPVPPLEQRPVAFKQESSVRDCVKAQGLPFALIANPVD
jgi:hypothetical protein